MAGPLEPMTYDDLTKAYRMEQKSKLLLEVRKDFYTAVQRLLDSIRQEYEAQLIADPDSIITEGLSERRKKMIDYSKRVIHFRSQKILLMAMRDAMGSRSSLDNLTKEERELYEGTLELVKGHYSPIINAGRKEARIVPLPVAEPEAPEEEWPPFPTEEAPEEPPEEEVEEEPPGPIEPPAPQGVLEENISREVEAEEVREEVIVVRVLEDLPSFAGPDRDYELGREDLVTLPPVIARALVGREKAVEVRPAVTG